MSATAKEWVLLFDEVVRFRQSLGCFFSALGYRVGVEVGVHKGLNAEVLLTHWPGVLFLVDPYEHQPWEVYPSTWNAPTKQHLKHMDQARRRLRRFGRRGVFRRGYSVQEAATFPDSFFDFVYIDGIHTTQSVVADIDAWWPKVRPGGTLCGHDYNRRRFLGVIEAVDSFAEREGLPVFTTKEKKKTKSWLVRKPVHRTAS